MIRRGLQAFEGLKVLFFAMGQETGKDRKLLYIDGKEFHL